MTEQDRLSLTTLPTPLEPAPRLAEALGLRPVGLWIKRDDLTGLGAGGNKVRKLERTVAVALRDGADTLVTTGAAQSNHARLTAAAGARLGLSVVLVLAGREEEPVGNLLLDGLFGATIHWAGDVDDSELALVAAELASRLAGAWAVVAAADPELGVHLARYGSGPVPPDCGSHGHELRVRDGNADDCASHQ